MAVANSQGQLLHRADSGGANGWEVVNVLGGRVIVRSPSKGNQGWLDAVINGDAEAWRSPPPEDHEHKKRRLAMEAESKVLADAESALAAQATLQNAPAHELGQTDAAKVSDPAARVHGDLREIPAALQAGEAAMAAALLAQQVAEGASEAKDLMATDIEEQLCQANHANAMTQAAQECAADKQFAEAKAKMEEEAQLLADAKAKVEEDALKQVFAEAKAKVWRTP